MTSVRTYSYHTPIQQHSGGTLGRDLCSASFSLAVCVWGGVRACVCHGFVQQSTVNPALCLLSHGNK